MEIKELNAPYNFVPINEQVFYPDWGHQVSQDIPFKDGRSGYLKLKIEALSPIFVRNGHTKIDRKSSNENYKSFCHTSDNQFFIPATSIKGTVRSVHEIMSFGKLSQCQNSHFYVRDISDAGYMNNIKNVHCGWLYRDKDGNYKIDDHGNQFKKVLIRDVDQIIGGHKLENFIGNKENFNNAKNATAEQKQKVEMNKLALSKYEIVYRSRHVGCSDDCLEENLITCKDDDLFISDGVGTYVFTGQPSCSFYDMKKLKASKNGDKYGGWTGKAHEYRFPKDKIGTIDKDLPIEAFEDIHKSSEGDKTDYDRLWRPRLLAGNKIPVFFSMNGNGKGVHSIGLTALYKYPAKMSVHDGIPDSHKSRDYDLTECIFGTIRETKEESPAFNSLRGRVQFGLAKAITTIPFHETTISLMSPHASYYPIYLSDNKTWENNLIRLSGRKRYILKQGITDWTSESSARNSGISPLNTGSVFEGIVRFHNLNEIELGSLISAITFHGVKGCHHSIGGGKPLGYGKVRIVVEEIGYCRYDDDNSNKIPDSAALLGKFENRMDKFLEGCKWRDSNQIQELLAISMGNHDRDDQFKYMELKDYTDGKNKKKYFSVYKSYRKITGKSNVEFNALTSIPHEMIVINTADGKHCVGGYELPAEELQVEESKPTLKDKLSGSFKTVSAVIAEAGNWIDDGSSLSDEDRDVVIEALRRTYHSKSLNKDARTKIKNNINGICKDIQNSLLVDNNTARQLFDEMIRQ